MRVDLKLKKKTDEWHNFIKVNYGKDIKKTHLTKMFGDVYIPDPNIAEVGILKLRRKIKL